MQKNTKVNCMDYLKHRAIKIGDVTKTIGIDRKIKKNI